MGLSLHKDCTIDRIESQILSKRRDLCARPGILGAPHLVLKQFQALVVELRRDTVPGFALVHERLPVDADVLAAALRRNGDTIGTQRDVHWCRKKAELHLSRDRLVSCQLCSHDSPSFLDNNFWIVAELARSAFERNPRKIEQIIERTPHPPSCVTGLVTGLPHYSPLPGRTLRLVFVDSNGIEFDINHHVGDYHTCQLLSKDTVHPFL